MTTIFKVTLKKNPEKAFYYTGIGALCTKHGKDEINVSKNHLYRVFTTKTEYENKYVFIEKHEALNKTDVENEIINTSEI